MPDPTVTPRDVDELRKYLDLDDWALKLVDAALDAERLAVVEQIRERMPGILRSSDIVWPKYGIDSIEAVTIRLLDEVGVTGLTGEGTDD